MTPLLLLLCALAAGASSFDGPAPAAPPATSPEGGYGPVDTAVQDDSAPDQSNPDCDALVEPLMGSYGVRMEDGLVKLDAEDSASLLALIACAKQKYSDGLPQQDRRPIYAMKDVTNDAYQKWENTTDVACRGVNIKSAIFSFPPGCMKQTPTATFRPKAFTLKRGKSANLYRRTACFYTTVYCVDQIAMSSDELKEKINAQFDDVSMGAFFTSSIIFTPKSFAEDLWHGWEYGKKELLTTYEEGSIRVKGDDQDDPVTFNRDNACEKVSFMLESTQQGSDFATFKKCHVGRDGKDCRKVQVECM